MAGETKLRGFISEHFVKFLRMHIDSGNSSAIKRGLQELARYYRNGYRINARDILGLENSLVGLLYTNSDRKVTRWSLNVLARIGKAERCMEAILSAIGRNIDDPDIVASGIAAIYQMSREPAKVLERLGVEGKIQTLSALQFVEPRRLDLSILPIKIDNAEPHILKLSLILIGLNKAPKQLFHPTIGNGEIIRVLSTHPDRLVSQYSIWSAVENATLGLANVGVKLDDIPGCPTNVRSWMMRLICKEHDQLPQHIEHIVVGSRDEDDVRMELSRAIGDVYHAVLQDTILEWSLREPETEIALNLLSHMVTHHQSSPQYEEFVLGAFASSAPNSAVREGMLARAANTPLYTHFRRIEYDEGHDLLGARTIVNNNTFNINNAQVGALSVGGNSTNSGNISDNFSGDNLKLVQEEVAQIEAAIQKLGLPLEFKAELEREIRATKDTPSASNLDRLLTKLKAGVAMVKDPIAVAGSLTTIAMAIAKLSGLG